MKSVLLIGLGRFGRHIAKKLWELHNEVLAVEQDEEKVNAALPYLTRGLIGDSTNRAFLSSLGIPNFDLCIVAIGDDFQSSLETTYLLKDLGAKTVVSRAARDRHASFLLRNGADHVVYPEKQLAVWTAIRYSSDHVFDYFELDANHAVYEIAVPADWQGKTVGELNVRGKWQINIMAVKKEGVIDAGITPSTRLEKEETILVIGRNDQIQRVLKLK